MRPAHRHLTFVLFRIAEGQVRLAEADSEEEGLLAVLRVVAEPFNAEVGHVRVLELPLHRHVHWLQRGLVVLQDGREWGGGGREKNTLNFPVRPLSFSMLTE